MALLRPQSAADSVSILSCWRRQRLSGTDLGQGLQLKASGKDLKQRELGQLEKKKTREDADATLRFLAGPAQGEGTNRFFMAWGQLGGKGRAF